MRSCWNVKHYNFNIVKFCLELCWIKKYFCYKSYFILGYFDVFRCRCFSQMACVCLLCTSSCFSLWNSWWLLSQMPIVLLLYMYWIPYFLRVVWEYVPTCSPSLKNKRAWGLKWMVKEEQVWSRVFRATVTFLLANVSYLPFMMRLVFKDYCSSTQTYMELSYGVQPPIPTWKSSSAFNPRLSDPFWTHLGT
jgi:hypothetical protein